MMNVVVFISGRGSNLTALLDDQQGYNIKHVISNNTEAGGLKIAHERGITNTVINWSDKVRAESFAAEIINQESAELVILAGFMRILSSNFTDTFNQKIINIHPSLLPDYPGLNTHQRVIDDQRGIHGASVHYVDGQLDHGQVISQTKIKVNTNDTATSLANQLIQKEHKLLTFTVGLIAEHKIYWEKNCLIYHNQPLLEPILLK